MVFDFVLLKITPYIGMTIKEKKDELKKHYDNSKFKVFFTEECEYVSQIDFEKEIVFYYVYVTDYCGCCSRIDDRDISLDDFLKYLSESDYNLLLDEIKTNKN